MNKLRFSLAPPAMKERYVVSGKHSEGSPIRATTASDTIACNTKNARNPQMPVNPRIPHKEPPIIVITVRTQPTNSMFFINTIWDTKRFDCDVEVFRNLEKVLGLN